MTECRIKPRAIAHGKIDYHLLLKCFSDGVNINTLMCYSSLVELLSNYWFYQPVTKY
uniref:Uncharacterized protein n=1 Tax=Francisella tularensis subsp. novicida F6168 TaxID=1452728 RepID=Q9LAP6_FRANO|nr:unknown [Francisella tularensis subsp. novicida F6168]